MIVSNGAFDFTSRRSAVYATSGMVATSQPLAAQAGLEILRQGGNAVDAAVATAAVLNVVEPMSTGVGGDMFALVYRADTHSVHAINGSGRSPRAATIEEYARRGIVGVMPADGPLTVTAPGAVDGWAQAIAAHGRMTLAEVLRPAIHYAEDGFPVSELVARAWAGTEDKLKRYPAAAATYLLDGRAPRAGEIIRQRDLARTLRTIAEGGPAAFHTGPIAEAVVNAVQESGGLLALEDLATHTSTWETPISTVYRGVRVYECPPNGQGLAALVALNLIAGDDLSRYEYNSAENLHLLIEAMKLGFADAQWYVTDPAFSTIPVAELLSPVYSRKRRALIDPHRACSTTVHGRPQGDTVYLSVVDAEGNACSFINSLYQAFGSGIVAPTTGIALQNRGALFSLDPGHPNRLEPRKRPYHTIIPAMATRDGELWASFGVMGGFMQPQGHLQVLVNMLDFDMDPQRALDAPRFNFESGTLVGLEEGIAPEVGERLAAMGHTIRWATGFARASFGAGQIVRRDAYTGVLWAGSDPRRDGCAVGY